MRYFLVPILLLSVACAKDEAVSASENAENQAVTASLESVPKAPPLNSEEMIQAAQEGEFAYDRFVDLVASCGLEFELPAGFLFKPGVQDKNMAYEGCLIAADGNLEVRLAIRPILGMELEYRDPHSSAPEPNHIYPLLEQSVIDGISNNAADRKEEFGDDALAQYNADWGAAHRLTPDSNFAPNFQELLLICLHGNNRADVYIMFLFQDGNLASSALKSSLHCLKFKPITTPSNEAAHAGQAASNGHGSTPDEN
jgi:hypothetical protein